MEAWHGDHVRRSGDLVIIDVEDELLSGDFDPVLVGQAVSWRQYYWASAERRSTECEHESVRDGTSDSRARVGSPFYAVARERIVGRLRNLPLFCASR